MVYCLAGAIFVAGTAAQGCYSRKIKMIRIDRLARIEPQPDRLMSPAMAKTRADNDGKAALSVPELQARKPRVEAAGRNQLLVLAFFHDAATLHYQDAVA